MSRSATCPTFCNRLLDQDRVVSVSAVARWLCTPKTATALRRSTNQSHVKPNLATSEKNLPDFSTSPYFANILAGELSVHMFTWLARAWAPAARRFPVWENSPKRGKHEENIELVVHRPARQGSIASRLTMRWWLQTIPGAHFAEC